LRTIRKVDFGKDENIYLYCRSGRRSGIALETLKKAGFKNLINLETVEKAAKALIKAVVQ
jgi:phage shock protein E